MALAKPLNEVDMGKAIRKFLKAGKAYEEVA